MRPADLDKKTPAEQELDRDLDAIIDRAFRETPPPVLYHYTSLDAAESIIRSQTFWLTSHACTNDPAEMKSAEQVIRETAEAWRGRSGTVADASIDSLLSVWREHHITSKFNLGLACFSASRDKESQWMSYADKGRGVCLGLRILNEPSPRSAAGLATHLSRVIYDENDCLNLLVGAFHRVLSRTRSLPPSNNCVALGALALVRLSGILALSAKESAWASEEEWRIVAIWPRDSPPEWSLRGPRNSIRYIALPLRAAMPLYFEEIIVGPRVACAETARDRITMALKEVGYPHVPTSTAFPPLVDSGLAISSSYGPARGGD